MIVAVGSKNKAKLTAVKNGFAHYFKDVGVKGVAVESGVAEQPTSVKDIFSGAKNRAEKAFEAMECDFSVGIEGGIFPVPETRTEFLALGGICIFNGTEHAYGTSPGFEYPPKMVKGILEKGKEIKEIFLQEFGPEKGNSEGEGAVGFLTKGVVKRDRFNELGVVMALVQIVNKNLYGEKE